MLLTMHWLYAPTPTTLPTGQPIDITVVQPQSGPDWLTIVSTLLATFLGGLLALAGSVFVSRWELRRTYRVRLHDELVPAILAFMPSLDLPAEFSWELTDLTKDLERNARIAGSEEFKQAKSIRRDISDRYLDVKRKQLAMQGSSGTIVDRKQAVRAHQEHFHDLDVEIWSKLRQLQEYLADKLA